MIFYQFKYKTKTDINKCFAYFLNKEYLLRTLPINHGEIFRKSSNSKNRFLEEGEELVIHSEEERNEFLEFMNNQVPNGIIYELKLKEQNGFIEINEISSVKLSRVWKRILVKLFGLYHQFSNRKTHEIIKKELNSL